jgi:regulator of telomere elongation helicase 1
VEKAKVERQELRDIEELHKLGKKHNFCPYYMSRELYQSADIIFMPYNYLLDDTIRKSLDIDFNGSVIIFDEGHNVQKLCEETSSFNLSSQDLGVAVQDLDSVLETLASPELAIDDASLAPKDLREPDLLMIKDCLLELEKAFAGLLQGKEAVTKPGTFAANIFASFINPAIVSCLELTVEHLNASAGAAFSARGRGVGRLLDFLRGAFNEHVTTKDLEELYKVHVVKESKGRKGSFMKSNSETIVLNLWCFSPGFSMRRLARLGPRSIIITSGTLSPLAATAEEIGLAFPVQLEGSHVVGASQVWCGVLAAGMDNTPLNSSFRTRSDPKYLNSLGQTVINLIKLVPKGVLVFFPSYSLLNSIREFWQVLHTVHCTALHCTALHCQMT